MKEEQERTETDLMKLLYERAEERYRTLEVRDGEFRTEEVKNILAGKKELETFDENLYRKIIARIWVHGGNMAEVELINGEPCHSRVQGLGGRADGRNSKKDQHDTCQGAV